MQNVFISFIFKDFRILKICFLVLTLYLLLLEVKYFLITKPTLTSATKTHITPETFPDILICPEEAFDLGSLQKLGYKYGFYYASGHISAYENTTGWIGNQTELKKIVLK